MLRTPKLTRLLKAIALTYLLERSLEQFLQNKLVHYKHVYTARLLAEHRVSDCKGLKDCVQQNRHRKDATGLRVGTRTRRAGNSVLNVNVCNVI